MKHLYKLAVKRNLMEKKGIWLVIIGLIFLLVWGSLHLRKGIDDQGSLTFGIVLLAMGLLFYFVYGKRTEITDEMLKKIQAMAMATTLSVLLILSAICYLVHTWWRRLPVDAGFILGAYVYGAIFFHFFFYWWYKKHIERLPF
jgi:uncharacterized membrane protein